MGRLGIVVDLAPATLLRRFARPPAGAWEEMGLALLERVNETLLARMPDEPEQGVLDTLDAACLIEAGCAPGRLTYDVRDDLVVTAHAGLHWTEIGLALLAEEVRAAADALGYRVKGGLGEPAALAAATGARLLRRHGERLVLVDTEHGEVCVDDGDEPVEGEPAEALLAEARRDPRCGCALCVGLRAEIEARAT